MKRLKKVSLVLVVLIFTLSGCKKEEGPTREQLIAEVEFLNSDIAWLEGELETSQKDLTTAQADLNRIQGILMETDRVIITELIDGTGRTSFVLGDDNELSFSRELYMINTTAIPNTARVILGGDVSIVPGGNWVTNVQGTTVHYSHPNGLRGTTKIGSTSVNADRAVMTEALDIYFGGFPTSTVVYNDIFISNVFRGIHARALTFVEEEPHVVHAFVISFNRVNLLGVFDFAESNTREELMIQLLSSISWGSTRIHLES